MAQTIRLRLHEHTVLRSAMAHIALALLMCSSGCRPTATPEEDYLRWLESQSMLSRAATLSRGLSGRGELWQRPYALPQPRAASALASVWLTTYPAATIARPGQSVLRTLADEGLWRALRELGVRGMHTGPMKRGGGIKGHAFTPSIDGNFDRISMDLDPAFGTEIEYLQLTRNARKNGGVIIGDVIPGHTGKGADFRLAERGHQDYPGLYHMVQIEQRDWGILPRVPAGRDSANLSAGAVNALRQRGYIVGRLPRTIFYEPGVKETDWSATDVVRGADGHERRWVYLHYFKEGQPTLSWLDPSFAAQRLLLGDIIHSLRTLGEGMLRLDANGFLGIEIDPRGGPAWSEGHPLAITSNQIISSLVRKLGGFTFQELNLTIEDIRSMSGGGADLSYDFITRPAYHHALVTGDVEFLRLMLGLMRQYAIDPAALIHALQNHDELTLELVHFWTLHQADRFRFRGKELRGSELRELIRKEMHETLIGARAPYNLRAANGVSCTSASLVAAALGIRDITHLSDEQRRQIQRGHLLLALYNALQPGIFALSGWDLVGALTLPSSSVTALMADGDTRWINRGAYDLGGVNPSASASASMLPRATALYGPLPAQLQRPDSFAAQLRRALKAREAYRLAEAELVDLPATRARGLLVMVHRLPGGRGTEVTALNFSRAPVEEEVRISGATPGASVVDLVEGGAAGQITAAGGLLIKLGAIEGRGLIIK